jgi:hypothetical protein
MEVNVVELEVDGGHFADGVPEPVAGLVGDDEALNGVPLVGQLPTLAVGAVEQRLS